MKLHLPKMLLTAVLAVVAGSGVSSGITVNDNYYIVSIDTRQETATYDDASFSYTGDTITIKGQNVKVFDAIITLDYDAFAGVKTNTDILYVNNSSGNPWGFRATTDGDVTGKWKANEEYESGASIMPPGDLQALATGSGDNQIISGLKVKFDSGGVGASLTTFTGESVFVCSGLKAGNATFTSVKLNKALVSSITLVDAPREGYKGAINTKGNWSHNFETATTTFLEDGAPNENGVQKYEVLAGDDMLLDGVDANGQKIEKSIVVGSATQLFLQAWKDGGNPDALNVERDIYIGSSTYNGEKNEAVKYHNAALRFGNDTTAAGGNVTNISGNIYIVEDAKMISGSTNAINFDGNVTDVVDGADTGSTLTIEGEGYVFKGTVDLSGLVLQSGSAATFSSASATIGALTTGGTVTNTGSLAVTGTLNLQNAITNSGNLNLSGTTIALGNMDSLLFTKVEGDVDGNGFLNGTATVYTNSGGSATASTDIGGVTYNGVALNSQKCTLSDGVLTVNDNFTYWIFNDTDYSKISSAVSSDANKTVRVTAGKTYDLKGTAAYNKVVLESGATLANTGNNIGSEIVEGTTYNYCNEKQNYYIELAGNANLDASGNFAMVAGEHECSTLKLNGHTLTKKGTGTVVLNSTVADAGTIAITAGKIWLYEHNDAKKSDLDEVAFTMSSGTTLRSIDSMTIKSLSSSGGSITVDSGKKLTVTGALALGAGTSQLSGSLKAANMTVTDGGKLSMTDGSVLDLTGKYGNLVGNAGELDACITLANSVTTTGAAYILMTGTSGTGDGDNANLSANQTLSSNVTFTNNLNVNGRGWNGNGFDFTVDGGATLKVGESGTGQLALLTKADFIIANGSVTAGLVKLGYGGTGANYDAYGTITLNNAKSKLTAQKIEFRANGGTGVNSSNALTMTAGTLEFTGDGAVFTGNNNDAVGNVSISGGEVVVNKNQSMDTVSGKRGVALSNMKFNIAADKSMSLDSGVAISNDVTVKGSGTLKFAGSNDLSSMGGTVKVTESAKVQYQNDAVQVAAKSAEGTASVTSAAIADAAVTVGGTADVTLAQALSNADLTYTGANKLTVTGTGSSLSSLTAQGNVDIMSAAATQQLNAITIGAGKTVGIYTGDEAKAITSSESTITTGSLTAGVDSVLNANLVLSDGATLNLDDALTMGSTLTLGTGIRLDADTLASINALTAGDSPVTLFEGVDSLVLGTATYRDEVAFSAHFAGVTNSDVYLGYDGQNVFAGIQSVPEPTTATLSLLALAGLAARRRRK